MPNSNDQYLCSTKALVMIIIGCLAISLAMTHRYSGVWFSVLPKNVECFKEGTIKCEISI